VRFTNYFWIGAHVYRGQSSPGGAPGPVNSHRYDVVVGIALRHTPSLDQQYEATCGVFGDRQLRWRELERWRKGDHPSAGDKCSTVDHHADVSLYAA
jgi:hypothetical protein